MNMSIIRHRSSVNERERVREREGERENKISGVLSFLEEREKGA